MPPHRELGPMRTTDTSETVVSVTRRRLLAFVGWGSFAAFWGSIVLATLRFFFPRILYEPSPLFAAGKPDDYQVGEVSTRFKGPRHGSNFLIDGTNVAGPAPVPLYRAAISLDVQGEVIVDKSQRENQPDKRDKPPFFLPLPSAGRGTA